MIKSELAHELKAAGFPQPEPMWGQLWYGGTLPFIIEDDFRHNFKEMAFAPTLDEITPYIPQSFALEMWGGKPSCTNRDDEDPLRTFGDTFAEAAARMCLACVEK